jgi:hypothetical protein
MFPADFSGFQAAVTPCDRSEMSLQSGEIRRQPAPPRTMAMDSRASHDTYRAAGIASLTAPPAPILATPVPCASRATVPGIPARMPDGVGAVVRAGSVVAPVLLDDGPGSVPIMGTATRRIIAWPIEYRPFIRPSTTQVKPSLQTDITVRYLARSRSTHGERVSPRTVPLARRRSGMVRGDRSLHLPLGAPEGTRSGDRRDVSLSPVPAPQSAPPAPRFTQPSRICRRCVAKRRS